jgi:ComF family protein
MSFLSRLLQTIPFECAICKLWPSASFEGVTGVCQSCIQTHAKAPQFPAPQGLDDCLAALSFDAPWAALIARYKFAPEPGLARLFAGLMQREERIRKLLASADLVMPLPLAPERLEERGFNQALTLAKHLVAKNKIDSSSLIRTRNTAPQRLLDREARQRNVANAFALQGPPYKARSKSYSSAAPSFEGKHILLIDDVMTTGATLAAAAAPLHRAGAVRISAVVIARTPLTAAPLPHPSAP